MLLSICRFYDTINYVYGCLGSADILTDIVYLDNSSTTKPCKEAIDAVNSALNEYWGNPSSLHTLGFEAENTVSGARQNIAALLKCREDELVFTGSGTEGNNTAIFGAVKSRAKRGNRIVTTSIEHPSVLEAMKQLEADGFEVIYLKPQSNGAVLAEDIKNAVSDKTILVSIMLVNNETGAIQPVEAAVSAVKQANAPALMHCDGVQAFGKMPIDLKKLGVDLFTASAHKIHGAKGIGILYIKKGVTIKPYIVGGGQEKGMRSGTESVPLICSFGAAVKALPPMQKELADMKALNEYAREKLLSLDGVVINSPENALPFILNISVLGYRSETLLHFLENKNIFVSSGSACAKGQGSYVLREMGLEIKKVDSALRLSFSRFNTKADIDILYEALKEAKERLRKAN